MQETDLQQAVYQKALSRLRANNGYQTNIDNQGNIAPTASPQSQEELAGQASDLGLSALDQKIQFAKERGTEQASIIQAEVAKQKRDQIAAQKAAQQQQAAMFAQKVQSTPLGARTKLGDTYNEGNIPVTKAGAWHSEAVPKILPVHGPITQEDTAAHSKGKGAHAWDIGAPVGTPVRSTVHGRVVAVKDFGNRSYGRLVVIQGTDGHLYMFGHLSGFHVKVGQTISPNQVIAVSGASGHVTGPHVHYEIR